MSENKAQIIRRLLREAGGKRQNDSVTLISALEFRREAYGLTATEFARVLGMGKSHYSEVVNGKRPLPIKALRRAYRVGVPAEILLR